MFNELKFYQAEFQTFTSTRKIITLKNNCALKNDKVRINTTASHVMPDANRASDL